MLIDITLQVTPNMIGTAQEHTAKALIGHMGTHFDVMDKEFPLEYTARNGVVFDVSHVRDRDVAITDINSLLNWECSRKYVCVPYSTSSIKPV